jgi:hypothetical protein
LSVVISGQTKSIKSNKRLTILRNHEKIKATVHRREISKVDDTTKIYHLINRDNGATMVCTEKFLIGWLARGFEVDNIEEKEGSDPLGIAVE